MTPACAPSCVAGASGIADALPTTRPANAATDAASESFLSMDHSFRLADGCEQVQFGKPCDNHISAAAFVALISAEAV